MSAILTLFVVWFVLMPLDALRFGWSDVPAWLQVVGVVGIVLSYLGMYLTFRENAYLYPVVKLQEERGQTVVTTGPYR
jgi:protein-S-isoprenylcysteine O-methyltransferase Ste14